MSYTEKASDSLNERASLIRDLVPELFVNGTLDTAELAKVLSQQRKTSLHTQFVWRGKADAYAEVDVLQTTVLVDSNGQNFLNSSDENMLISGDNAEALKHLRAAYTGKVKMIYIDPPYNTGQALVYADNLSHAEWLSMMYTRISLGRQLLRSDGVFFISIDDYESHRLRLLLDEVFGEKSYMGTFVWKRRSGANDAANGVTSDHEYVLAYAKDPKQAKLAGIEKTFEKYQNPDGDLRGPWARDNLTCNKTSLERPNLYYPITDPATGRTFECDANHVWRFEPNRMARLIEEGKVLFPERATGRPAYKRHLAELRSNRKPISTWLDEVPLNAQGTREVRSLLDGQQIFTYPKPVQLLETLIQQATSDDDIVLDFFAGTGTTGHGVITSNLADGGNRRFILVQLPELVRHDQYETLVDVTAARLRGVLASTPQGSHPGFRIGFLKPER